ncbi:uncharacterized protein [Physeter macrocephalus]|uniref:Uncharacterized protein isoform X1 n=1 Tax=Physeter macrocephalus TaxID=9755 RepID=A0A455AT23_PHYMC|nr:uncharacterized protein LOC114484845 isoform X1 [Physeter catodon]|eukprot:XP_028339727.1 uncharacterized protein LOC114484845 isoform X1 [Physeter catodon]
MPSRMPRFHSADRPLTPARRFPRRVPGPSRETHGCRGDPSFTQNSSVRKPGQARVRARVCASITSPTHHVPSEPGSPYSKAQRAGVDGSGTFRLPPCHILHGSFKGRPTFRCKGFRTEKLPPVCPASTFLLSPKCSPERKTSRFHRTSHRKSLWGRPKPPFPHDWLGAAANSQLTSAPGACEPELPADAGLPTPAEGLLQRSLLLREPQLRVRAQKMTFKVVGSPGGHSCWVRAQALGSPGLGRVSHTEGPALLTNALGVGGQPEAAAMALGHFWKCTLSA